MASQHVFWLENNGRGFIDRNEQAFIQEMGKGQLKVTSKVHEEVFNLRDCVLCIVVFSFSLPFFDWETLTDQHVFNRSATSSASSVRMSIKVCLKMAAYIFCLTTSGGVPIFTRQRSDLKPVSDNDRWILSSILLQNLNWYSTSW